MAFSFTKYFKKDSSGDPGQDSSQVQSTSVEVSQEESSQPSQSGSYSGIGNPPQNQAQNPVQNSPVPPPAEQVQNTEANSGLGQAQAETPGVKDSTDPTKSSIDMGKRVGMDVLSRLTQRANAILMKGFRNLIMMKRDAKADLKNAISVRKNLMRLMKNTIGMFLLL